MINHRLRLPTSPWPWKTGAVLTPTLLLAFRAMANAQANAVQGQGIDWTTIQSSPQAHPLVQIARFGLTLILLMFALKGSVGIAMAWNPLNGKRAGQTQKENAGP